ncbi:MAG: RluA family pseudouridine synthase [Chlamydiales bacterium]|nr:RluA family pseudouridine synthase [Chlamydiales bacterium]
MKLIEQLSQDFPESSKRTLLQWIKFGRVLVDGKPVTQPHHSLEEGESYSMKDKKQEAFGMRILYRDKHFVVIDKPPGLLSVPSPTNPVSALKLLNHHFKTKNLFAVHRIDQDTSGALLFVWGKEGQTAFDPLFFEHKLEREYCAIVEGNLPQDQGTWELPLTELESYEVVVDPNGKKAITHFQVVKRSKQFTYLKLRLETGRKHQIRVHCKEAGYPILGDRRYGKSNTRLFLHAHTLAFVHPFTGKEMRFAAPLPPLFKKRGFPTCQQ